MTATANPPPPIPHAGGGSGRVTLRAALRIAGILLLFAICGPIHVVARAVAGRSRWPRRFLAAVVWLCGARVKLAGRPPTPHTLLLANHSSWLDIVLLAGATDCAFVSKDNLGHGLLHWLADQNGTVYVKRGHVKGAKDQAVALAKALEGEKPVTVFPEATTGPGTHLLPFRSTLLEAANYAARDVVIRPVAIDYGSARAEVGWWNEPGMANVLRILGRRGTMPVTVRLLEPLERTGDRKQLAHAARGAIAAALGFKLAASSPIGSGE